MSINTESITDDPAQLKAALAKALSDLSSRDAELAELRLLVDYLQKQRFRKSSESYIGMKSFFDDAKPDTDPEAEPARARAPRVENDAKPVRKPLPDAIDREVVRHELPESDRRCSCCGGDLHEIGAEVSEQLDIVPATVKVIRHERVKYGCRGCETGVTTAPMPKQPIPKSLASPATLAHIAVAKYADHLPLYRQEELWDRLGVTLDRGTMASWMIRCGEIVRPIINLMRDDMVKDGVVHCDESPIRVLDKKKGGKKSSSDGYMWVLSRAGPGPEAHIFTYDPTRSGKVAADLLAGFKGVVVTDGYSGYKRLAKDGMTRAGCWAHVRRTFFEATEREEDPTRRGVAHRMLAQIKRLYLVERAIAQADNDRRLEIRRRLSSRVMVRIEALLNQWIGVVPSRTATGKALDYLRNEWQALQVFLREPTAPIDNNRVENVIRPLALGRKNWLFAATTAGADASGNLYSLIQTAIVNDLEPQAYLARVFADLPNAVTADDVAKLLPYPDQH